MNAYYDTGVLVCLYIEEVFSDATTTLAEARNEAIPLCLLHQLELENALRLKVFRGEMEDNRCRRVLDKVASTVREGRLVLRPVNWIGALEDACRISAEVTAKGGCRTLDLMHVAIAVQWRCEVFVTADDRQLQAARSVGLKTIDVRTVARGERVGGSESGAMTGTVREKRARYKSRTK